MLTGWPNRLARYHIWRHFLSSWTPELHSKGSAASDDSLEVNWFGQTAWQDITYDAIFCPAEPLNRTAKDRRLSWVLEMQDSDIFQIPSNPTSNANQKCCPKNVPTVLTSKNGPNTFHNSLHLYNVPCMSDALWLSLMYRKKRKMQYRSSNCAP